MRSHITDNNQKNSDESDNNQVAYSSEKIRFGMSFKGKPIHFNLYNEMGYPLPDEDRYKPMFRERCDTCGMRLTCNGCSNCGKCEK